MSNNENRGASTERYVAVALGTGQMGVLDRARMEVAENLGYKTAAHLNSLPEFEHPAWDWTPADRLVIIGELGPVPEGIKPPFEPVKITDEDGDTIEVMRDAWNHAGGAVVVNEQGAFYTVAQAPAIASAILRAAGVDPESVDWDKAAKGGE